MAWYLWLTLGVVIGTIGFLVFAAVLGAADEPAHGCRRHIERQQHAAERQLDALTFETLQRMFEIVRGGDQS